VAAIVAPVPVVAVEIVVVNVDGTAGVIIARVVRRSDPVNPIPRYVIVEATRAGQLLHQLGELSFGIVGASADREAVVVPAIADDDVIEPPGVRRNGAIDQPRSVLAGSERRFPSFIAHFIPAPGPNP
jgi:hypothetical protein